MKLSEIYAVVDSYYQFRGLTYPSLFDAAYWLVTEVGELQNALTRLEPGWVRNNSEDEPLERVSDELGDVLMMFAVVAHLAKSDVEIIEQPSVVDGRTEDRKYFAITLGAQAHQLALAARGTNASTLEAVTIAFSNRLCAFSSYMQINPYKAMLRKFHKKVLVEHTKVVDDFANWEQYRLYLETLIKNEPA